MKNRYAIVQNRLSGFTPELLRNAFALVRTLTDIDSATLSRDAFGIVAECLSESEAITIADYLNSQSVSCFVVEEDKILPLPPVMAIHAIELISGGLTLVDQTGKRCELSIDQVLGIGFGCVQGRLPGFTEKLKEFEQTIRLPGGNLLSLSNGHFTVSWSLMVVEKANSTAHVPLILDLITTDARYRIDPRKFLFTSILATTSTDYRVNMRELLLTLSDECTAIWHSCGSLATRSSDELYVYPSMHAFEEEQRWILFLRDRFGSSYQIEA